MFLNFYFTKYRLDSRHCILVKFVMFMECGRSRQWRTRCVIGDWWPVVETKDGNCCGVNHGTKQASEAVSQWEEQKQRRRSQKDWMRSEAVSFNVLELDPSGHAHPCVTRFVSGQPCIDLPLTAVSTVPLHVHFLAHRLHSHVFPAVPFFSS